MRDENHSYGRGMICYCCVHNYPFFLSFGRWKDYPMDFLPCLSYCFLLFLTSESLPFLFYKDYVYDSCGDCHLFCEPVSNVLREKWNYDNPCVTWCDGAHSIPTRSLNFARAHVHNAFRFTYSDPYRQAAPRLHVFLLSMLTWGSSYNIAFFSQLIGYFGIASLSYSCFAGVI